MKEKTYLTTLSELHKTDKNTWHNYIVHYEYHLQQFRNRKIKLLEIGIGGYDNPKAGGESLRMWKDYFKLAEIFGIDIYDKSELNEERITTYQGSQTDENFLNHITTEHEFDVIIDDGSHVCSDIIKTFKILFPKLKSGGIYVIEDLQTSYWSNFGGDSLNLNNANTSMNFLKSLTDCLNHQEIVNPNYTETYFDKNIVSIHFYHNLVFIYKGNNDEVSWLVNNHKFLDTVKF